MASFSGDGKQVKLLPMGWELDWKDCKLVEVVPGKVSGVPLIRGTRVPVDQVLSSKDGGESIEEIAYNFDLNPEDIMAVLAFRDSRHPALRP